MTTVITMEETPSPAPIPVAVPIPNTDTGTTTILANEIQEVEANLETLREQVNDNQADQTRERLDNLETVIDHLADRMADLIDTLETQQEPPAEEISTDIPVKPPPSKVRKPDKPPKPSNPKRQFLLGRSGGVYP